MIKRCEVGVLGVFMSVIGSGVGMMPASGLLANIV